MTGVASGVKDKAGDAGSLVTGVASGIKDKAGAMSRDIGISTLVGCGRWAVKRRQNLGGPLEEGLAALQRADLDHMQTLVSTL